MEYEDVLTRDSLFEGGPLDRRDRERLLDALLSVGRWVPIYFLWRPNLPDEAGNHLVELAVAGGAGAVVTMKRRDVARGGLRFAGLSVLTPADFRDERKTG